MWTSGFAFSIFLSVASATEFEPFNNNDWIPVSNNIVYNQIRRGFTQAPRLISTIPQKHENIEPRPDTKEVKDEFNDRESTIIDDKNLKSEHLLYNDDLFINKYFIRTASNEKSDVTVRKSKKLTDTVPNVFLKNVLLPKNEHSNFLELKDSNVKFKVKNIESKTDAYEVTEIISNEDEKQEESEENGYEYKKPVKQNSTNDLIKHLFKYNTINVDNLQNYALSLRPKAKSPVKQDILQKTLQFRVPIRYNSLNHLLVDPLLAVFLSNYGYYLQGQYGIQNNYNNWYGYLASNNIHNNRPFGLYKLFSDTDSSN